MIVWPLQQFLARINFAISVESIENELYGIFDDDNEQNRTAVEFMQPFLSESEELCLKKTIFLEFVRHLLVYCTSTNDQKDEGTVQENADGSTLSDLQKEEKLSSTVNIDETKTQDFTDKKGRKETSNASSSSSTPEFLEKSENPSLEILIFE